MLTVEGVLYGKSAHILIDSGSSTEFLSADFVRRHRLKITPSRPGQFVRLADGSRKTPDGRILQTPVRMARHDYKLDFTVLPLRKYDAILGMSWLRRYRPIIDWEALTFEPTVLPSTVHTANTSAYKVQVERTDNQLCLIVNSDGDVAQDLDCMKVVRDFDDVFAPLPSDYHRLAISTIASNYNRIAFLRAGRRIA